MAKKSGILAGKKPAAATGTVLYSTEINQHASAVINVANDGTAAAYSVALKKYDQKLVYGAVTNQPFTGAFFHEGDVITNKIFNLSASVNEDSGFEYGQILNDLTGEKECFFNGFVIPLLTTIHVKVVSLRAITLSAVTGAWTGGETVSVGSAPDNTEALIYDTQIVGSNTVIYVGPSTINGSGAEFADADVLTSQGGATGTVIGGGIAAAANEFVFSEDGANGEYEAYLSGQLEVLNDRTYRFDVSDASMAGRDFRLSTTINGTFGPDNTAGTADDGVEFVENKLASGTAGQAGAFVQYGFTDDMTLGDYYFYDAGDAAYGGDDRALDLTENYQYTAIYVYDVNKPWTDNADAFRVNSVDYTVTSQSGQAWGYVRDAHHGMHIEAILGHHSAPWAVGDIVYDNPVQGHPAPVEITQIEVDVDEAADYMYIAKDKPLAANAVDRISSVVVGPGDRVLVESATQNNVFTLVGFIDDDNSIPLRNGYDHLSAHVH